ncbi:hypothetical protein SCHPADRAFT_993998 [Schizopora paradoxa]|uniref:Uncharacterized protein n=1 Tax=Schizopora paradoxa TaxID=27342 RepID=A0A0H2S816_9AGAM|nr:hypothetical protein SCHPADRAFT_993998 [Schizopora paradoxa]
MNPTNPTFCFDSKLQTHFQCNNTSDALLARLLLTDGVEDTILDLFLSVVNDPNFNPKDVTFKHSGDVHRLVGEQIKKNTDSLGNRSLQHGMINVTAGLPSIVLDGVIDVLKGELEDTVLALRSKDGVAFTSINPPFACFGFVDDEHRAISICHRTLSKCCVVHTSWLSRARRALGCFLISPINSKADTVLLPGFVRSPLYSTWTRQVELKVTVTDQAKRLTYLTSLFSRMPSVTFLQLNFTEHNHRPSLKKLRELSGEQTQIVFEAICSLLELEQLVLVMENDSFPHEFFRISLPKLKRIFISGTYAGRFLAADPLANPFLKEFVPRNPSLQHITIASINHSFSPPADPFTFQHISWSRMNNSAGFLLDAIGINLDEDQDTEPSDVHRPLLSRVRYLRVCGSRGRGTSAYVCAATSASSISLCLHGASLATVSLALHSLCDSVECVQLVLAPIYDGGSNDSITELPLLDVPLANAVTRKAANHACRLRRVVLAFLPTTSYRVRIIKSAELHIWLPQSKAWCEKLGVLLESTVVTPNDTL